MTKVGNPIGFIVAVVDEKGTLDILVPKVFTHEAAARNLADKHEHPLAAAYVVLPVGA